MKRFSGVWATLALALCLGLAGCSAAGAPQVHLDERMEMQAPLPEQAEAQEPTVEPELPADTEPTANAVPPAGEGEAEQTYAAALATAFLQTGALDDMVPYSDADLLNYYGIDPAACESIVYYIDAVGYTNELLIVQTDEAQAAEFETRLAGYLEDRAAQFAGYDADAETLVRQAVLRCDGGVVLMIVSPEADALLDVYRGFTF